MKSNIKTYGLVALALFLSLGVSVECFAAATVTIKGKSLDSWIKKLRGKNRGLQVRAARALGEAPEKDWPAIATVIIPILKSERANDRFVAAQTLGTYGAKAKAGVPGLLTMLDGTQYERNRAAASKALGQILKDEPTSPQIDEVTKKLVALFQDKYPDVRRESVRACGMIGPAAKACMKAMVHPLEYNLRGGSQDIPYAMVRSEAAWTLSRMGPLAKDFIDRLISLMHIDGMSNQILAIGNIGAVHENVVPNLVDFIEKKGKDWRNHAGPKMASWVALEKFGPKSLPAVPLLASYLRAGSGNQPAKLFVQWMKLVSAVGPKATEALPGVKKWAEAKQAPRGWSAEGLKAVNEEAAKALAILKK